MNVLTLAGALHALGLQGGTLKAAGLEEWAMSQENVEIVLASIAAFNAGDIDAQVATYGPNAEVASSRTDVPDSAPVRGRAALRTRLEQDTEAFRHRYVADEVLAVGGDCVLCRGRIGLVGVASGIDLDMPMSLLFTIQDGLIAKAEFFSDHADALKAVGLEE